MIDLNLQATLEENFAMTAARLPEAPAITFLNARLEPTTYTFASLRSAVDELACAMRRAPFDGPGPVGILASSQETQVLHYLATLKIGRTPAILTPPNRKLNREYYIETARAVVDYGRFSAVVVDDKQLDIPGTLLEAGSLRRQQRSASTRPDQPEEDCGQSGAEQAAFLQFSSGTTGVKKGVAVTDRAALRQLQTYARAIELQPDDCILSWLPLYHDMGFIACLNLPLAMGVHCVMMHPLDWVANPGMLVRAVSKYRATLSWNPNFAYSFMAQRVADADLQTADLSSLRGLINCSEPVTFESQQRFSRRFEPCGLRRDVFWGCYAMAETTFALTHGRNHTPGALDHDGSTSSLAAATPRPLVSVGSPLPDVQISVRNEARQPVDEGHLGEIWVRSPFNFAGYYRNRQATDEAFDDGWYKTGDVGYCRGDQLFVCARKKDLLIVGGVNVCPQDLEDIVASCHGVHGGRVVAFSEFDQSNQTEKITVLAESDTPAAAHLTLTTAIRQRILAALQVANFSVFLVPPGWLLKSSAGKIARQANREKWLRRNASRVA